MPTLKFTERIWKYHRFPRIPSTLFDLAVLSQNIPQFLLWWQRKHASPSKQSTSNDGGSSEGEKTSHQEKDVKKN